MGMADEFPLHNTQTPHRQYAGPPGECGAAEPKSKMPWYVQHNMRQERRKNKGKEQWK